KETMPTWQLWKSLHSHGRSAYPIHSAARRCPSLHSIIYSLVSPLRAGMILAYPGPRSTPPSADRRRRRLCRRSTITPIRGDISMADHPSSNNAYWKANLRIIGISLVIWFVCSFGMGIILRPALSGIMVGGADLGFWMAQNGSIYIFIILIFVYAKVMNRLDREHGVEE